MKCDRLPRHEAQCLVALMRAHSRDGRATVRSVGDEAGLSVSSAHKYLVRLRRRGLVTWTDGAAGTLRPVVHPVALPTRRRRSAA